MTAVAPNVAELIDRAAAADDVRELFAAASVRLRRLVPFDSAAWLATDPATSLPTSPTRVENMGHFGGHDACLRLWELEFLIEDVNLFQDLANCAAACRGAVRGDARHPGAQPALPRVPRAARLHRRAAGGAARRRAAVGDDRAAAPRR